MSGLVLSSSFELSQQILQNTGMIPHFKVSNLKMQRFGGLPQGTELELGRIRKGTRQTLCSERLKSVHMCATAVCVCVQCGVYVYTDDTQCDVVACTMYI